MLSQNVSSYLLFNMKGTLFFFVLKLLIIVTASVSTKETQTEGSKFCYKGEPCSQWKIPVGDMRYCLQQNKDLLRMEVLPGNGWDNLRNLNMGMVTFKNYSQCLTSEDGKYLIPDNTYVIALKQSNVALNSEYFDHWNNYSSMTSSSINAEAHGGIGGASFGGKFSEESQSVKKHQVENKAVTTRAQLRYKFYTVKAQPDMQLHPVFKSRLLDIAAHLQCNNTAMARYMADLIVRDFGTHYISSIDAGAVLSKIDHVKSSYVSSFSEDKSKITASASASFFSYFGASISHSHQSEHQSSDAYTNNTAHSEIHAIGGPPYRANFSLNQWEDGLPNNLVAVDKAGDPLHYAITPEAFPELAEPLANQLSEIVSQSVKQYYKHNSRKGCTDPNSPNFNFQAILDDRSCKESPENFIFGGIFQECDVLGSPASNPCDSFQQKNPKTRDYRCPVGYQAVLLHKGYTPTSCHRECHGWWFWRSCKNDCGYAQYSTYWCAATGQVENSHSGYMFGGLYNKITANPLTGTRSCPLKFYPQHFGPEDMFVCISDDYDLGSRYSLSFAGFFSCSTGNPLASKNKSSSDSSNWPKQCPTGFSQHLAVIDEDCEINYCVKSNALSGEGMAPVRRPPFRYRPKISKNITVPLTIINDDTGKVWIKEPNLKWIEATDGVVLKHLAERDITKGAIENLKSATKRIDAVIMKHVADIDISERAIDNLNAASKKINAASEKVKAATKDGDTKMSAGAAIGVAIGVISLLVIIVAIIIRKKRKRTAGFTMREPPASSVPYDTIGQS